MVLTLILTTGGLCAALAAIAGVLWWLYKLMRRAETVVQEADKVASVAGEVQQLAIGLGRVSDRLDYLSNRPLMNGTGDLMVATVKAMHKAQQGLAADVAEVKAQQAAHMKVDHRIPGQWRPTHDDDREV